MRVCMWTNLCTFFMATFLLSKERKKNIVTTLQFFSCYIAVNVCMVNVKGKRKWHNNIHCKRSLSATYCKILMLYINIVWCGRKMIFLFPILPFKCFTWSLIESPDKLLSYIKLLTVKIKKMSLDNLFLTYDKLLP